MSNVTHQFNILEVTVVIMNALLLFE